MAADVQQDTRWRVALAPYGSTEFEHVKNIRIAVFVDEQKYSLEDEMDEHDSECIHILLYGTASSGEEKPAGTLRYFPPPKSKVGRVAVSKAFRGKGAGGVMMTGLEGLLRGEWGADEPELDRLLAGSKAGDLSCHAQVPVVPFYRGLGWVTEGDEFIEDGTPHILMRKSLISASQPGKASSVLIDTETQA